MENKKAVNIAVVDDHRLFRAGLIDLVHSLGNEFKITMQAGNGKEFLELLSSYTAPDIVMLDMDMPVMDGYETAAALQKNHPAISVLVITMVENEKTLIKMLQMGIKGYLSKDVEPAELRLALHSIADKGFYYTDYVTGKLIDAVNKPAGGNDNIPQLSERELVFLKYTCSDFTYKEIADKMCLSIKTIDGYRNALFEKLDVKSRTGLAIYAIKHKIVTL
ncbi:MAG TPA: response regulator transcription factor [Flavobacteriales bacterium]|nr:response regulator transcription factor [Flavobacteriales bacterium]